MTMISAVMWQDSLGSGQTHWLMIFVGLVAFAMLVQAGVMVAMAFIAFKVKTDLTDQLEEMKAKVFPLVAKSQELMLELTPKINDIASKTAAISANAENISAMVKDKLVEFGPTLTAANQTLLGANQTARIVNQKAQEQVSRVSDMVSGVLDATAEAGKAIQRGINVPVREVSGLLGGVKAGLKVFMAPSPKRRPPVYHAPVGTYEGSAPRETGRESGSGLQSD